MLEELEEKIKNISLPLVEELHLDLVELRIRRPIRSRSAGQGRTIVIEILADRPTGGITIEECSVLNRNIYQKIETEQLLEEEYTLEVSSPGLDRPLKTQKDFLRVIDRRVRVHLLEPLNNKREYEGQVREVNENQLVINGNAHSIAIPIEQIALARQIIE